MWERGPSELTGELAGAGASKTIEGAVSFLRENVKILFWDLSKSRNLQDVHGGNGSARHAACLCGISLKLGIPETVYDGVQALSGLAQGAGSGVGGGVIGQVLRVE